MKRLAFDIQRRSLIAAYRERQKSETSCSFITFYAKLKLHRNPFSDFSLAFRRFKFRPLNGNISRRFRFYLRLAVTSCNLRSFLLALTIHQVNLNYIFNTNANHAMESWPNVTGDVDSTT